MFTSLSPQPRALHFTSPFLLTVKCVLFLQALEGKKMNTELQRAFSCFITNSYAATAKEIRKKYCDYFPRSILFCSRAENSDSPCHS
jgi:hypothetical protein